jgi:hypothetical protein
MSNRRDPAAVFGKIYEAAIKAGEVERVSPNRSYYAAHLARAERILVEAGNPADPPTSTPAWYARRILYQSLQLETERDRGDIDAVIETAVTIGMLLRELAVTQKHGGAVAFHAEQAEVLSTANTSRTNKAKATSSTWQAKANEAWKRHPTYSVKRVAEIIAGGANPNTVRRKIRKPGK